MNQIMKQRFADYYGIFYKNVKYRMKIAGFKKQIDFSISDFIWSSREETASNPTNRTVTVITVFCERKGVFWRTTMFNERRLPWRL